MASLFCSVYFLLAFCVTLLLLGPTQAEDPNKAICDMWKDMASQMTGSGRIQTCLNNHTKECTRIDCTGTFTFSHPLIPGSQDHPFEIDYCFGSQLNSCNDPVSMDFYFNVPDKNVNKAVRIKQAEDIEIPDLKYSLGSTGHVSPVLDFEFDRTENSNIKFSVKTKVKLTTFTDETTYIGQLERTLINEETLPAKSCDHLVPDTSTEPPKDFSLKICHPGKYVPLTPSQPSEYTPSETLDQTCDTETKFCGENEICDTSKKPSKCTCMPETTLSAKKDACLHLNTLGKPCNQIDDCGFNEECKPPTPGAKAICQCKHGYMYKKERHMCTFVAGGGQTIVTSIPRPHNYTTAAPKKSSEDDKNQARSNMLKIVGGALGGIILVAVIIVVIIVVQRRRRRSRATPYDHTESSNPLLGNDDDDADNMVM